MKAEWLPRALTVGIVRTASHAPFWGTVPVSDRLAVSASLGRGDDRIFTASAVCPQYGNKTIEERRSAPREGGDPNGDPRDTPAANGQIQAFFERGEVLDVCAGKPCVAISSD